MSDKILAFLQIVLNIIRSIVGNPALIIFVVGFLTVLLGFILNVGGVIVLGVFLLGIGAIFYLIGLFRR